MSEVVISGNVAVTKAPAPAPVVKVDMPPPVAPAEQLPDRGEGADVRLKNIGGELIEAGEDGRGLREEIRRQKREADPIYAWDASAAMPEPGPSESWGKQIRRASESMYEARLSSLAEDLQKVPGANAERARRAAEFMAEAPPIKVVPVSDAGQFLPPLLDDQPVSAEHEGFRNMAEASRAMRNYRDLEDRQRQALADELTQRQEQIELQAEQAQAQAAQAQVEQKEVERAQQAQAAHAAAATRAQQEAAALQQVRQMSLNEAELAARIQRHEQQVFQRYPEVLDWEAWQHTQKTNPARAAEIQREGERSKAAVAQFAKLQQDRQVREYAIGQYQTQQAAVQREAWSTRQDEAYQREVAKRHPQFTSDEGRTKLQRLAREYLEKDLGLTRAQIDAEWRGGALRSAAAQLMLADAAVLKAGKESMLELNSRRAPVPPVQRPGTFRPAGAGAVDQIADLQRQLDNATGNQSLRIATKLTQARRDAGLL
jgi:hypothetical protein